MKKVKVNGKILDKGKLEVFVKVSAVLDYKQKWGSQIGRVLFNIYINYLAKNRMRKFYFGPTYVEGQGLFKHIKESLELHSY